jgi:hypothetical protein
VQGGGLQIRGVNVCAVCARRGCRGVVPTVAPGCAQGWVRARCMGVAGLRRRALGAGMPATRHLVMRRATHTRTHVYTHACTHTRVYTHTHTHTHTRARARATHHATGRAQGGVRLQRPHRALHRRDPVRPFFWGGGRGQPWWTLDAMVALPLLLLMMMLVVPVAAGSVLPCALPRPLPAPLAPHHTRSQRQHHTTPHHTPPHITTHHHTPPHTTTNHHTPPHTTTATQPTAAPS